MANIELANLSEAELQAELAKRKKLREKESKEKEKQLNEDRENLINNVVAAFSTYHDELKAMKREVIDESNNLYRRMYAIHGKEPRDVKEFTLVNKKQDKKLQIQTQERMTFTDEAKIAIDAIRDFFKRKFASRSKAIYNILDTILMRNGKGDYDPKLLAKLRKQVDQIDDPELTEAYELLEKSQVVVGSATYLRAYRKDEQGKWKDIVLQFSSL